MKNLKSILLFALMLIGILTFAQNKNKAELKPFIGYANTLTTPLDEFKYNSFSDLRVGFEADYYLSNNLRISASVGGFFTNENSSSYTSVSLAYDSRKNNVGWYAEFGKMVGVVTLYRPKPLSLDSQQEFLAGILIPTKTNLTYLHGYDFKSGWGLSYSISERGNKVGEKTEFAFQIRKDDFKVAAYKNNSEYGFLAAYTKKGKINMMMYYTEDLFTSWISFPLNNNMSLCVDFVSDSSDDKFSKENDFVELMLMKGYGFSVHGQKLNGNIGCGFRNDNTFNIYFGVYFE